MLRRSGRDGIFAKRSRLDSSRQSAQLLNMKSSVLYVESLLQIRRF